MKYSYLSLSAFAGIVLLAFITSCSAQAPSTTALESKAQQMEDLVQLYADYGQFNGTVLVADENGVVYKDGLGLANMEWEVANHSQTKFRLASITKQFTAMLIMQLVAKQQLSLDSSIQTYLPEYPKAFGGTITVHHLLTHSSGIPNYTSFSNYRDIMGQAHSTEALISNFRDSMLRFIPGSRFEYSNSGYVLLGAIIERITGGTYEQALQERIFTPLKMNNSGVDQGHVVLKNRASGYYKMGKHFENASYIHMTVAYAAGCIYSTVEDLYLWDQALYTEQLLPQEYRDVLFERHILHYGHYYGYGWEIDDLPIGNTEETIATVAHGGFINGFNTCITRVPSKKAVVLLLNNTGGAPLNAMTSALLAILLDQPYDLPKKPWPQTLRPMIEQEGLEKSIAFYEANKDLQNHALDENEMNLFGYELLQAGKINEAAAVLKITMEAFPDSFNAYDSYGEAQMALGNKAEAIALYQKSLELNPNNQNGIQMLKKLSE